MEAAAIDNDDSVYIDVYIVYNIDFFSLLYLLLYDAIITFEDILRWLNQM